MISNNCLPQPAESSLENIESLLGNQVSFNSGHGNPVVYSAGTTIFREGELANCAYLIEDGRVQVSRHRNGRDRELAILEPGDVLGEMAIIDGCGRSATATAIADTQLLPIDREQIERAMDESSPMLRLVLGLAFERLRATLQGGGDADSIVIDRASVLTEEMNAHLETTRNQAVNQIKLEKELRQALARREFVLHYQPIVSLPDRQLVGFEALIRWIHPERGQVAPIAFIGPAEESGLIVPIGMWVLEHACREMRKFQRAYAHAAPGAPPLFMGVNVSARQLLSPDTVDHMVALIRRTGLKPECLKLEVTESLLISKPEAAASCLKKLKRFGAKLAIDDFGTGQSCLSYLYQYPLDTLKLDRAFVSRMLADQASFKIIEALTGLGKALGMQVVAEGVETEEESTKLSELGCDLAQGYLYSRPVPGDRVLEILSRATDALPHV